MLKLLIILSQLTMKRIKTAIIKTNQKSIIAEIRFSFLSAPLPEDLIPEDLPRDCFTGALRTTPEPEAREPEARELAALPAGFLLFLEDLELFFTGFLRPGSF